MSNSFLFPLVIADEISNYSDAQVRALLVYFRHNQNPSMTTIEKDGFDEKEFWGLLASAGIFYETRAKNAIVQMAKDNEEAIKQLWHLGDGYGGGILEIISKTLGIELEISSEKKPYRKSKISQTLRTSVFERDAYRCVKCGSYKDLTCDHIYPESLGGKTTKENLQTLCRSCNSKKGTKVGE